MTRTEHIEAIIFRKVADSFEFLLLLRTPVKGSFWQPVTGGVESFDESVLDAAFREVSEETGIGKNDVRKVHKDVYTFTMDKDYLTGAPQPIQTEYVFGFEVGDVSVVLAPEEHVEYKWVDFDTALDMLKWDSNKTAFRELKKLI